MTRSLAATGAALAHFEVHSTETTGRPPYDGSVVSPSLSS